MEKRFAVLPCNGLDKPVGQLAREIAMALARESRYEIICPVLLNNSPMRYEKALEGASLLVIDGCATRCASKLVGKLELRMDRKALASELIKDSAIDLGESLALGPEALEFAAKAASSFRQVDKQTTAESSSVDFGSPGEYLKVTHDKFIFRIPATGYLFNDNDCWVRAIGNRARVGVSDFVQQSMTDITFFEPPRVGAKVEQFDETGTIESAKATLDIISPVAGVIVAVNSEMTDHPEWVNEDPYGKGWIAELELADFESDAEFLLDADAYSEVVKRKAAEAQKH